jgi:hypothetical protein
MSSNSDIQVRNFDHHELPAIGAVIGQERIGGSPEPGREYLTVLKCPNSNCDCRDTHVVDVVWECDPSEGDRRWVRLEVRCEEGHGYFLLIRNHAGQTRLEYKQIDDNVSPFAEGARW